MYAILNTATDGIITINSAGTLVAVNPAARAASWMTDIRREVSGRRKDYQPPNDI